MKSVMIASQSLYFSIGGGASAIALKNSSRLLFGGHTEFRSKYATQVDQILLPSSILETEYCRSANIIHHHFLVSLGEFIVESFLHHFLLHASYLSFLLDG